MHGNVVLVLEAGAKHSQWGSAVSFFPACELIISIDKENYVPVMSGPTRLLVRNIPFNKSTAAAYFSQPMLGQSNTLRLDAVTAPLPLSCSEICKCTSTVHTLSAHTCHGSIRNFHYTHLSPIPTDQYLYKCALWFPLGCRLLLQCPLVRVCTCAVCFGLSCP